MKKVMINSILAVGLIGTATSALAIDAKDIINRMETRGYTDIQTSTTLFGNTLIVGIIDGSKHEFVINKSGVVLREHLQEVFKSSKIFDKLDADGDGQLSADERNNAKSKIREKIDADGDGQLSADEKNNARSKLREKIQGKIRERRLSSD